jgi:hypothetical protein
VPNPSDIHAGHGVPIGGSSTELISFAGGRDQRGVGVTALRLGLSSHAYEILVGPVLLAIAVPDVREFATLQLLRLNLGRA